MGLGDGWNPSQPQEEPLGLGGTQAHLRQARFRQRHAIARQQRKVFAWWIEFELWGESP